MFRITRNRVFILLAAGALAMGIAGGTLLAATVSNAHAHGGWGMKSSSDGASLASRVAAKLNEALNLDEDITEAQVQTAFNGVTADRQDEWLAARLDELEAEDSVKTEITDWFSEYPYDDDLIRLRFLGLAASDKVGSYLERLVENDRITQAQSDAVQSWYDDRPELPEGLERSGRWRHGSRHSDGNGDGDGAATHFRGRHGRGGDGAGASFRGRHGRDGDGVGSFFRGGFPGM